MWCACCQTSRALRHAVILVRVGRLFGGGWSDHLGALHPKPCVGADWGVFRNLNALPLRSPGTRLALKSRLQAAISDGPECLPRRSASGLHRCSLAPYRRKKTTSPLRGRWFSGLSCATGDVLVAVPSRPCRGAQALANSVSMRNRSWPIGVIEMRWPSWHSRRSISRSISVPRKDISAPLSSCSTTWNTS